MATVIPEPKVEVLEKPYTLSIVAGLRPVGELEAEGKTREKQRAYP